MRSLSLLDLHAGEFSSCKEKDESQCGLTFSNSQQAVFCPIENPISWPAILQVCLSMNDILQPAGSFSFPRDSKLTLVTFSGANSFTFKLQLVFRKVSAGFQIDNLELRPAVLADLE